MSDAKEKERAEQLHLQKKENRAVCWAARDDYFACLEREYEQTEKC